jgi:hypothetical protein
MRSGDRGWEEEERLYMQFGMIEFDFGIVQAHMKEGLGSYFDSAIDVVSRIACA